MDTVYDEIYKFSCGFSRVRKNNRWNYINKQGKLLSNIWFDKCEDFQVYRAYLNNRPLQTLGSIMIKNKTRYIDIYGNIKNIMPLGYTKIRICYSDSYYTPLNNIKLSINNNIYRLDLHGNISHFYDG